jgi:DNA-binding MarR family transcriptional regulator
LLFRKGFEARIVAFMQTTETGTSPQQLAEEAMRFFAAVLHGPGAWLQVIADLDLSMTQLKALYRLGDAGERTVSELAGDLRLSTSGRDALRNVYETRRSDVESAMASLSPQERDGLHAAIAPILERTRP